LELLKLKKNEETNTEKTTKYILLHSKSIQWQNLLNEFNIERSDSPTQNIVKRWYKVAKQSKNLIFSILRNIQQIRNEEWCNAKNHHIRIGKYGSVVRTKKQSGPVAGRLYPTKPGEPIRRALNDTERKDASIKTHNLWMDNPPGRKNCHFLDIINDDIGPHGVSVNPNKKFDAEVEWNYLEGLLSEKVNEDIANRIMVAHQKLPKLFQQIKTDARIVYPFKYDCCTGLFLYPEVEENLRKNATKGNGKARATGFAIPVLGRLPKVFLDTYIIKCKVQMTLRLLDTGTECSLRICIGKPCGGVWPLTVGHGDNVFLNGLAQQAIQREIARFNLLPENLYSYQKGKGCNDAMIVDCIVKEIALQNDDFYLAELSDDAKKMFDRLYVELQVTLLLLA